ncbi:MAG TPA: anti-sigma factor [Methylomirabilota bacterium]|nr:anti-sigma factor [Methylomirabilota bacterium]
MNNMQHVTDDLELFALDALPAPDRARVAAHLVECPACREQARLLEEVAIALPNTLPQGDLPARLRARVLASARADSAVPARRRETAWTAWLSPSRLAIAGLAVAVLALGLAEVANMSDLAAARADLAAARAERDAYAATVVRVAHGGKSWYMAGLDQWAGSGGTLYGPSKADAAAYVVFHDLRPLATGSTYALWLVDVNGHWQRAANFAPNGDTGQAVILDVPIEGFAQCAVTVEAQREGKRTGPLVMQSRIAPPATP